jgi:hypothetical protein
LIFFRLSSAGQRFLLPVFFPEQMSHLLQAATALREVKLTKATVIAPVVDLFETVHANANFQGSLHTQQGTPPPSERRSGSGSVAPKRTFQGDARVDHRIEIVFNDRHMAESSGDHLTRVATQCVSLFINDYHAQPSSAWRCTVEAMSQSWMYHFSDTSTIRCRLVAPSSVCSIIYF